MLIDVYHISLLREVPKHICTKLCGLNAVGVKIQYTRSWRSEVWNLHYEQSYCSLNAKKNCLVISMGKLLLHSPLCSLGQDICGTGQVKFLWHLSVSGKVFVGQGK